MKKSLTLFFVVLSGIIFTFASLSVSGGKVQGIKCLHSTVKALDVKSTAVVKRDPDFGNIPLYFIPNQGQVDEKARFYAKTPRYTLWMTKEGLVFDSIRKGERDVSRLMFLGANKKPGMVPIEMTQHKVNYFKGDDSSGWQAGIRTSKAVLYKNVYRDIDLKVYGIETRVEYDWIVKPGADPKDIRFDYQQVSKTHIDKEGNLVIKTAFGEMMHRSPVSYQIIDGKRVTVKSEFRKTGENSYGFKVEKYDKDFQLVIDPMVAITYSTYLGGSADEEGLGIEVDSTGIYVAGYTHSSDFPTAGSCLNSYAANDDIFVTRFTPDGSGLIYSDIIGGSGIDRGTNIVVAPNGHVFGTGYTYSSDLPADNSRVGKRDVVFFELDANGCLVCLRYLGGTDNDSGTDIALDSSNNSYITGYTYSSDFPVTPGAFQTQYGGNIDAFVCKVNCSGIIYCTYLGGTGKDIGYGVALDASNNVYVTGYTESDCFPLNCSCQECSGKGRDAFVARLNPALSSLICCKCLQGSDTDSGTSIAVDSSNNIYVSGETNSDDFPIKNAIQADRAGGYDAFVAKLNPNCGDFVYSTYLGGAANDVGWRLVVDDTGAVYLTGYTDSNNFPVKNPFQSTKAGGSDVYAAKIDANGTHLIFSTYLGGSNNEVKGDIAICCGDNPDVYVTGGTGSDDFPVHNPYQCIRAGGMDAFVTRYTFSGCAPVLWVQKPLLNFGVNSSGTTTGDQLVLVRNIGGGTLNWTTSIDYADGSYVDWITCSPGSGRNCGVVTVSVDAGSFPAGTYKGSITFTDSNAANSPQTVYVTMIVHPSGGSTQPFGAFETPATGANVHGSVPFSGWALDDIEVVSVEIMRGTPPNLIKVGDAVFCEGARPDVSQVYPNYPFYCRGGWGFVLQANLLGNGSYNFYARLTDKEANQVDLGPNTVNIVSSVNPFGAVDTPEPAGTAFGSDYGVQGWALTPVPKCITEVKVFIDGAYSGLASYGDSCVGIPELFPGYCDTDAPCFHYDFNTIGYSNGMHTLYCEVTDDGAVSATIGSRYFYILNIGSINSFSQISNQEHYSIPEITGIPVDYSEPVKIEKGYGMDLQPQLIPPDEYGQVFLEIKELERIKVQLNAASETGNYIGYQIVGNHLVRLPIGSTLDREKGIFYWQAGPGFIGLYQFVFIREKSEREKSKMFITVKIGPKFAE